MNSYTQQDRRALVIFGGGGGGGSGGRACCQGGVLRAIAGLLPKKTINPFQIITGASAGAVNAVSLAAQAQRLRIGVCILEYTWKNLAEKYRPSRR